MLVWPQRRVRRYQGAGTADNAPRPACSEGEARSNVRPSTAIAPSCATNSRRVVVIVGKLRVERCGVQRVDFRVVSDHGSIPWSPGIEPVFAREGGEFGS